MHVTGEIDFLTAPALRTAVSDGLARPALSALVVDLTGVTFLGCAGVTVLIDARLRIRERGGALVVVCPRGAAPRRILVLLGLDDVLTLVEDFDALDGVI
ncbi:anti-anti-sigma factor [Actinokineospora spheciospongiae]|nr:anti-anti-sigma factor [Actinokineospora spheciospongiae]